MSTFNDIGLTTGYFLSIFNISSKDLKEYNPGVYKITCLKNNKVYIGKGTKNVYWRVIENIKNIVAVPSTNKELYNDLMAYGLANFRFEIIATCKNPIDASTIEKLLIGYTRSSNPSLLYNKNQYQYKLHVVRDLKPHKAHEYDFFIK